MTGVNQAETVIATHGLSRRFGDRFAVEDLNLTVHRGEIYGFLGRNGAGKTTTIRMILGLIRPTRGSVRILGETVKPNHARIFERIGSLVESPGFYPNLTVYENLEIQRMLTGIPGSRAVHEVIELFDLEAARSQKAGHLSSGTRQRLGLARAMINHPEILVLDEPTNAMDPAGIKETRLLLKRLAEERKITIFMSSHILAEVQQLATRIGIIHQGRLVEEINYDELRRRNRTYLEFRVSDPPAAAWALEAKLGLTDYSVHEEGVIRVYADLERAGEMNRVLVSQGVMVSRLTLNEENLEDHFMRITGEKQLSAEEG